MNSTTHFLPEALRTFLKRRLNELYGLVLILIGIYICVALGTYDSADPSWNTEISSPVRNMGGAIGAIIGDILYQTFGLGGFLFSLLFFSWGRLRLCQQSIHWVSLKCTLFVIALIFCSMALYLMHLPSGAIGYLAIENLFKIWTPLQQFPYKVSLAILCSLISIPLLVLSYGLTFTQAWRFILLVLSGLWKTKSGIVTFTQWSRTSIQERRSSISPDLDDLDLELEESTKNTPNSYARMKVKQRTPSPEPTVTPKADRMILDIGANSDYQLPPLNLLSDAKKTGHMMTKAELEERAVKLMEVLEEFGVRGEISEIRTGPVVTLYELVPAAGIKSSRVIALADDIARSMSAISARVAVVPGRNAIGIELPNEKRQTVFFKELLTDPAFEKNGGMLPLVLGQDIAGHAIIADLARMPHLLVAGTTGSGKSVGINSMILSLLYRMSPNRCKFIMIDPKMLELSIYNDIPHLLTPVVTDPKAAIVALKWAVREMENRYRDMSKLGVRNITGYNERIREALERGEHITRRVQTGFDPDTGMPQYEEQPLKLEVLPYIVIVVDEMADLMLVAGKDIEAAVQRLAQMARAAGIHLIMATQRPSVDVITGTIKANFPTRISFQVTSKIDSRTILGEQGAEQLLGMGDMLFMAPGGRTTRVHGPFVSDSEVEKVVQFLRQQGQPTYIDSITDDMEMGLDDLGKDNNQENKDELYHQAVTLVMRENKVSTSFIQRYFQIGYNRAARIVEQMEAEGVISPPNRMGRREILAKQQV